MGPEELLGGFYYYWSGAVRADFVTANFAEHPFRNCLEKREG